MTIEERNAIHDNYTKISELLNQFEHEAYQAHTIDELNQAVDKFDQAWGFQYELSNKLQEN